MLGAERVLIDGQRALEEWLGLRVGAGRIVQRAEIVERDHGVGMLGKPISVTMTGPARLTRTLRLFSIDVPLRHTMQMHDLPGRWTRGQACG
jgi:hypothetical protein